MRWALRTIRILSPLAHATESAHPDAARAGDVIECVNPPVYEVDPMTRTCRDRLQRFLVASDGQGLIPVSSI